MPLHPIIGRRRIRIPLSASPAHRAYIEDVERGKDRYSDYLDMIAQQQREERERVKAAADARSNGHMRQLYDDITQYRDYINYALQYTKTNQSAVGPFTEATTSLLKIFVGERVGHKLAEFSGLFALTGFPSSKLSDKDGLGWDWDSFQWLFCFLSNQGPLPDDIQILRKCLLELAGFVGVAAAALEEAAVRFSSPVEQTLPAPVYTQVQVLAPQPVITQEQVTIQQPVPEIAAPQVWVEPAPAPAPEPIVAVEPPVPAPPAPVPAPAPTPEPVPVVFVAKPPTPPPTPKRQQPPSLASLLNAPDLIAAVESEAEYLRPCYDFRQEFDPAKASSILSSTAKLAAASYGANFNVTQGEVQEWYSAVEGVQSHMEDDGDEWWQETKEFKGLKVKLDRIVEVLGEVGEEDEEDDYDDDDDDDDEEQEDDDDE